MFSSPVLYIDSFTDIGLNGLLTVSRVFVLYVCYSLVVQKPGNVMNTHVLQFFLSKYIYIKQNEMKTFIVFNLQHVF